MLCIFLGNKLPSPIVHTTVGYLIYRIFRNRIQKQFNSRSASLPLVLMIAIGISLLPDIDSVAGVLTGDFIRYHNNISHSFFTGVLVAFSLATIAIWVFAKSKFWIWFLIFFLGYSLHILMDYFTIGGRGVMLFWPLSFERFDSPVKFFYGVRWSEGLFSPLHLNTLINELGFVLVILVIALIINKRRPSSTESEGLPKSAE